MTIGSGNGGSIDEKNSNNQRTGFSSVSTLLSGVGLLAGNLASPYNKEAAALTSGVIHTSNLGSGLIAEALRKYGPKIVGNVIDRSLAGKLVGDKVEDWVNEIGKLKKEDLEKLKSDIANFRDAKIFK